MNNRKNCRFYACQSRELLVCLPGIAGGGSLHALPSLLLGQALVQG